MPPRTIYWKWKRGHHFLTANRQDIVAGNGIVVLKSLGQNHSPSIGLCSSCEWVYCSTHKFSCWRDQFYSSTFPFYSYQVCGIYPKAFEQAHFWPVKEENGAAILFLPLGRKTASFQIFFCISSHVLDKYDDYGLCGRCLSPNPLILCYCTPSSTKAGCWSSSASVKTLWGC